jgi:ATP-dependent RNA/DNA helicase IGHMBP2
MQHPHLTRLLQCVELEEKEQAARYGGHSQQSLKLLKAEGLVLHPIVVTRKNFGYADYPEISFRIHFPPELSQFRDGAAVSCFCGNEEPVKGMLLNLDGKTGELRLFAPDFPDWMEDDGVGIQLAPDTRTTTIMKTVLRNLPQQKELWRLFEQMHDLVACNDPGAVNETALLSFKNNRLNESQQKAVSAIVANHDLMVVHGPPGTGKTTTLIEAVRQLVAQGEKVVVAAPSNTAVDHFAKGLLQHGVKILRVGNTGKTDEAVFAHTPEGRLSNSREQKEIKTLKIRAEEFRRMAMKYKRSFGKAEREQRNLLLKEVKNLRTEIKKIQAYNEEKLYEEAQVILGTPIGLYDAQLQHLKFHSIVLDEAGQCIEPLACCVLHLAPRRVLAGDHLQLPPTVLSEAAVQQGFNQSILEKAVAALPQVYLLNTQYRMRAAIAGFSSHYFYKGLLQTATHLQNTGIHISFIDTAGSGYEETHAADGASLQNEGELRLVEKLMVSEQLDIATTAFIAPYSGQVSAAKERLPRTLRISTIDSFQGQEMPAIILSLVRSNEDGIIGFLKDYRRMNVALTRAQERLFVIGDSATLGADPFYSSFLNYVEQHGQYRTVWEWGEV